MSLEREELLCSHCENFVLTTNYQELGECSSFNRRTNFYARILNCKRFAKRSTPLRIVKKD